MTKRSERIPSKQAFEKYEHVRKSGRFNMLTQSAFAAMEADLSSEVYWSVIRHYGTLKEKYGNDIASS